MVFDGREVTQTGVDLQVQWSEVEDVSTALVFYSGLLHDEEVGRRANVLLPRHLGYIICSQEQHQQ